MKDSRALLMDQFTVMINTECYYVVSYDEGSKCIYNKQPPKDDDSDLWRRKICLWYFRVVDHLQMDREVVSVALNLFDRFLLNQWTSNRPKLMNANWKCAAAKSLAMCHCFNCQQVLDSRNYQLAALTSLYLAMKIQSSGKTHIKFKAFVQLSRGQFTVKDVCNMEQIILFELQWQVHPPTPMMFSLYMLALFMPDEMELVLHCSQKVGNSKMVQHVIQELSQYLTELAICFERECQGKQPSQVAFCAILASMNLLNTSALPIWIRESFYEQVMSVLPYNTTDIIEENSKLQAFLRKALLSEILLHEHSETETIGYPKASKSPFQYLSNLSHPISIAREYGFLDISCINVGCSNRKGNVKAVSFPTSFSTPPDSPAGTSTTSSGSGSSMTETPRFDPPFGRCHDRSIL